MSDMLINEETGVPYNNLRKSGIECSVELIQDFMAMYGYDLNDLAVGEEVRLSSSVGSVTVSIVNNKLVIDKG